MGDWYDRTRDGVSRDWGVGVFGSFGVGVFGFGGVGVCAFFVVFVVLGDVVGCFEGVALKRCVPWSITFFKVFIIGTTLVCS